MDAEDFLDARGLRCPLPVIRMEAALRRLAPGGKLRIAADDPIAAVDIPHFAHEGGHRCERLPSDEDVCVFMVTRGEKA
ncbi:MAG: sulfurtransferase TusA family protein [Parvularculaceae bacterium]